MNRTVSPVSRMRDVHDFFGSHRLTHVPRALLRKVGERRDSIVVNGENKQLPRQEGGRSHAINVFMPLARQ